MKKKIQDLQSYFQACGIIGMILLISTTFPEFKGRGEALHVARATLLFPSAVGAFLLFRLKKEFANGAAPHEKSSRHRTIDEQAP